MKKIFTLFVVFSILSCEQQTKELTVVDNSVSEEITFIIELSTKGKSKTDVEEFTQYLSDFIVQREPSTVYGYYISKDGKKVTLIERYNNNNKSLEVLDNLKRYIKYYSIPLKVIEKFMKYYQNTYCLLIEKKTLRLFIE